MSEPPPTVGSLFAGIGGFDLGFERAGFAVKWQVELEEFPRRVLAKHWPDARRHDDVKTFPPQGSGLDGWRVDVIIGGFPCQDVSVAGKRGGLSADTRSGLWSEYRRVVALLRPRFVVVENTPGLLAPIRHGGRLVAPAPAGRVLGELSEIGFDATWQVVPASAFGAPHIRERVFIIAHAPGDRVEWLDLPARQGAEGQGAADAARNGVRVAADAGSERPLLAPGDATEQSEFWAEDGVLERGGSNPDRQGLAVRVGEPGDACEEQPAAKRSGSGPFTGWGWWGAEPDVVRMVHGVPRRLVRPAITGLGNAVVPEVAEYVGRCVMHRMRATPRPGPTGDQLGACDTL